MTTSSAELDHLKSQVTESYVDFTPDEVAALMATTSVPQFEALIRTYIKAHDAQ